MKFSYVTFVFLYPIYLVVQFTVSVIRDYMFTVDDEELDMQYHVYIIISQIGRNQNSGNLAIHRGMDARRGEKLIMIPNIALHYPTVAITL